MPFTVYYENDPEKATAPAQIVIIEDPLASGFDWTTFELGDINLFGDFVIDVPAGLSYYATTADLRPEGINLLVDVTAGIDGETGMVRWKFRSLDPDTLDLPTNPLLGFLAVNDKETHIGEGHVDYFVRTLDDLASGVRLQNQAFNTFDTNEPLPTPITLHTIDNGLPSSRVNALPAQVPDDPFTVSWTGTDEAHGSGVGSYTIFVSQDGGPWKVWLRNTTETSALFTGFGGHHYDFYSIARDNVGHEEPPKTAAEAGTDVDFSQLRVNLVETLSSGFGFHFRRPLDPAGLNLYGVEAPASKGKGVRDDSGASPDITVVGQTVGAVAGSLVYDHGSRLVRFVKTGGPLAPDVYTITLRSADDGFKDTEGNLLDGDGDDQAGGNFVQTVTVAATAAPFVGFGDFTRGPGEDVDLTGAGLGIPLVISNGLGLESLDLTFTYDPAQLIFTGVAIGAGMPAGSLVQANFNVPGIVSVGLLTPTPLPAGAVQLATFTAAVPEGASYGVSQVIDVTGAQMNEGGLPVRDDDAVHTTALFGDTTGNGTISSLDAQRALRVAVGLDTGFAAFPALDPVLIADLTGNGALSSLDAVRILRLAVGLPPAAQAAQAQALLASAGQPAGLAEGEGDSAAGPAAAGAAAERSQVASPADAAVSTTPATRNVDRALAAADTLTATTSLDEPLVESLVERSPLEEGGIDAFFQAIGSGSK